MPNIGIFEMIVVLVIALVIFGPKRLPEMGRSVGRGMREFKDSLTGDSDDDEPLALSVPHAHEAVSAPAGPLRATADPSPGDSA